MRGVPLFSTCSRAQLAEIATRADEVDFPAGRELIREGEAGREFLILVEGEARVTRGGKRVGSLGPGEFAGEIALVSAVPRTATITTATPVRALVLTQQAFNGLLDSSPTIQRRVMAALGERLARDAHIRVVRPLDGHLPAADASDQLIFILGAR